MDGTVIMQLVTSLGASGVLAWYCWHVTSKTLPDLVTAFRAEVQAIRKESAEERKHHDLQTERIAGVMEKMLEQCRVSK